MLLSTSTSWADNLLPPQIEAKAYILMDEKSGAILDQKNIDQARPPASMTKMMSALVILDQIKAGKLNWTDIVTVSDRAAKIEEAQIKVAPNDKLTVRELYTAMLVYSANDATVALAEYVGGGKEENFVSMMNAKAKELGMTQTHFRVSTGLDMKDYPQPPQVPGEHVMSARDTAILARELMTRYPEVLSTTKIGHYTFFKGTNRALTKPNWNLMLKGFPFYFPGVDGMKTGHTNAAGYCFTGTALRNQIRYITVVMGAPIEAKRFTETKKLLKYGFEGFEQKKLVPQGNGIPKYGHLPLPNGVDRTVPIVSKSAIELPIQKGKEDQYTFRVTYKKGLQAPLLKGTVVGQVELLFQGKPVEGLKPYDLITYQPVEEGSWIRLFSRQVVDQVKSWF